MVVPGGVVHLARHGDSPADAQVLGPGPHAGKVFGRAGADEAQACIRAGLPHDREGVEERAGGLRGIHDTEARHDPLRRLGPPGQEAEGVGQDADAAQVLRPRVPPGKTRGELGRREEREGGPDQLARHGRGQGVQGRRCDE